MSRAHFESTELKKNGANHVPLSPLSLFKRTCDVYPNQTAVIYQHRHYTWSEVYQRSLRFASALQKKGIQVGDTVSYIAPNVPECFEAHFAVPLSGAVLNTINIRLDPDTIAYILSFGDSRAVVCDTQFSGLLREALSKMDKNHPTPLIIDLVDDQFDNPKECGFRSISYEQMLELGDEDFEYHLPDDEWQALSLNFTSGTGGVPKGVVYHHRGSYLMTMGTVMGWELPMHPKYLYTVPMFHCNGWGHAWTMAALAATVICCRQVNAKNIFEAVDQHKVTHMGMAPVVLSLLVNAEEKDRRPIHHKVKIMTAGAPPPPNILAEMAKLGFEIMQVYGLTETYGHVVHCAWQEKWNALTFPQQSEKKSIQGVAFPGTESLKVVDVDTSLDVAKDGNTLGEVLIRSNTMMKGYYKNPKATEEAFKNGWFHTGDLAVMYEDGYIEIKDRLKDIIISGGENISSIEIEKVLYKHPSILAASVVAMSDEKWGEVPCAFVEIKGDDRPKESDIIAYCRRHLAGFKCPKKVLFVELPKTATGKIQKYLLRKQLPQKI